MTGRMIGEIAAAKQDERLTPRGACTPLLKFRAPLPLRFESGDRHAVRQVEAASMGVDWNSQRPLAMGGK